MKINKNWEWSRGILLHPQTSEALASNVFIKIEQNFGLKQVLLRLFVIEPKISVKEAFQFLVEINATLWLIWKILEVVSKVILHQAPYLA